MSEIAMNNKSQENSAHPKNEVLEPVAASSSAQESAVAADTPTAVDVAAASPKAELAAERTAASPRVDNKKTPVKRTPSKRMSFIERAQKESEELVKNLGGSLELEGGRRTRSSTRGTPTRSALVATPPPTKKSKTSPVASSSSTTPSRRVRGRKLDTSSDPTHFEIPPTTDEKQKKTAEAVVEGVNGKKGADNNGTEKKVAEKAEDITVTTVDAISAPITTEDISKATEESATVSETKSNEDKTDGVLKSVSEEEKQNHIDHKVQENEEEQLSVSPMETDAPKPEPEAAGAAIAANTELLEHTKDLAECVPTTDEDVTETKTATTSAQAKQLTPEPMEVDSSSSKDDNMNDDVVDNDDDCANSHADAEKSISTEVPLTGLAQSSSEEKSLFKIDATEATTDVTPSHIVDDPQSVVVEADVVDAAAAGEPQATTNSTIVEVSAEEGGKAAKEICEAKIVSPPTTESTTTATPQSCN